MPKRGKQFVFPGAVRWPPIGQITPGGGVGGATGPLRVLAIGQSNMTGMFTTTSSPPAAAAKTYYWNGASLTTVPVGNGVREFMNALAAAYPTRDIYIADASVIGATAEYFAQGQTGYTDALALVSGMGGCDLVILHNGEGVAAGTYLSELDRKNAWKDSWSSFHNGIEAVLGHTVPVIAASLATYGGSTPTTPLTWWTVQGAIREWCTGAASRRHFSHSLMDMVLLDAYHYNAVSYAKNGKRYAHTVKKVAGLVSTNPTWFITAVDKISTTVTRFTVAHSMGTDFTPTSSITGFELSQDGSTWVSGTGARVDATHIDVTHTALGNATSDNRYGRYDYGTVPTITGIVLDNGTLAAPLALSASQTLADYAYPAMSSSASPSVTEQNGTFIQTLTASRASTFAIGGTDAAQCQILNSNELHWVSARLYASPADSGSNNVYDITATPTATDNGDVGSAQSVAVTVNSAVAKVFLQGESKGQGPTLVSGTVDIGAATSDRFILIGAWNQNAQTTDPVVTVAGVTLSKLVEVEGGEWTGFYGGLVTAGSGSQAYSIQFSPDIGFLGDAYVAAWSIKGLVSTTPVATGTVNHASSLTVSAGDFLFIVRASGGSSEALSNSPTQAPDRQQEISGGGYWRMFDVDWTIASSSGAFAPGLDTTGINGVFVRMK